MYMYIGVYVHVGMIIHLYVYMHILSLSQAHPNEALKLSSSLYSCFCEQLPDAKGPPMKLASLSPQLARQLALSFTTLFPFHVGRW